MLFKVLSCLPSELTTLSNLILSPKCSMSAGPKLFIIQLHIPKHLQEVQLLLGLPNDCG